MENNEMKRFEKISPKGKKYYFFKNVNEIIKLVENNRTNSYASSEGYDPDFYGTKDMDEALDLAKFGWQEGAKKLNNEIKMMNSKMEYINKFDVVGRHVSVPRYINGHPQSMIRRVQVEKRDNVVNLIRFASVVGSVNSNEMIKMGVDFVTLVQSLESKGYRCNVDVVFASDGGSGYQLVRVRIKNSNERLNVMKMSFPMCHPSMFRRFIFKLREIEFGTSYGFCSWNKNAKDEYAVKKCNERMKDFLDKNDYLIPMYIEDIENFELKKIA